ncbi:GNAT family N-acetyltransferase [Niabella ginsengisoli]|uniref:GNAT family N-acetyltransferase n=1 Tax=Niabella ginsengisoli TaxID=522298 RepID=A0ABS9SKD0_9BACT|nr:GNAT family N-acetyltransferase [Niabella ginsengisoli]MCH5598746.1 GNAT family N-acetyltransferase [Niabella ginsengisoli]
MKLSIANPQFASQIRTIYAPFIQQGYITFETELPDIQTFEKRITNYSEKYPWLVMEENGKIIGYAYASAYRERTAYQWVVECSVYVDREYKKRGVASKLYAALFELLKAQGIYKVYAVITIPNSESVGFHERLGFTWFATYKNVGFKLDKWCDVGWWELTLTEAIAQQVPETPILFPDLDQDLVKEILHKHSN